MESMPANRLAKQNKQTKNTDRRQRSKNLN